MKEKKNMKKKVVAIAAVVCAAAVGLGGAWAYYSATSDTKQNQYTVTAGDTTRDSDDQVEVKEENFPEGGYQDQKPNTTSAKDPKVISHVNWAGYAMVKVSIPVVDSQVSGDSGSTDTPHEMFIIGRGTGDNFTALDLDEGKTNGDWKVVQAEPSNTAGTNSVYYFLYVDSEGKPKTLDANGSTGTVFDNVKIPNFTHLAADDGKKTKAGEIDVKASLTQAEAYSDTPNTKTTDSYKALIGAFSEK